eukprot:3754071-Amphidinium_carterae.1
MEWATLTSVQGCMSLCTGQQFKLQLHILRDLSCDESLMPKRVVLMLLPNVLRMHSLGYVRQAAQAEHNTCRRCPNV